MAIRSMIAASIFVLLGVLTEINQVALRTVASPDGADTAAPVDLAKVDRTISREPIYRTETQKYCLVVFGPQAKARMWLVTDGNSLHVDRSGAGDWQKYIASGTSWRVGDVVQAEAKYFDFKIVRSSGGYRVSANRYVKVGAGAGSPSAPIRRDSPVRVHYAAGSDYGSAKKRKERLVFSDTPDKAPILHFGGPLSFRVRMVGDRKHIVRGSETSLLVYSGTHGLGRGTFTSVYVNEVFKFVTIQFPAPHAGRRGPTLTFQMDDS